jgi:hypothetical protein
MQMRRILLFCAVLLLFCNSTQAAISYGGDNYRKYKSRVGGLNYRTDPVWQFINELEGIIEDATLEDGNIITFDNGLTIDNSTNNAMEFNENSEELILTFSSDSLAWTSTSGVVTMTFGSIIPNANQFIATPVADPTGTTEGTIYYDSDNDNLYVRETAGWTDLTAGAGSVSDLDTAYNGGNTIDVDGSAVTLTVSDGDNNVALALVQNDSTNDNTAMTIASAADAANAISLDIDSQTTGRDIEGTGASFYVEGDGSIVGVDADFTGAGGITLQNDETILNDVDNEIQFSNGTEDVSFNFGTSNQLHITSDTGVVTVDWLDVDTHGGIEAIIMDTGTASSLTNEADGAADDLTIAVTGAFDSSLILSSAGTGVDALQVTASAGGIDISSQNDIDITTTGGAGEDITITNSGGSVNIEATEGVADAIVLNASTAAGGIDITSNADIDITTTGAAGEDITITNTGGSIAISATEDDTAAITIQANGGTSESVNIVASQGTGEDALDIDATAGGIDIDAATGKNIAVTGGQFIVTSNEDVASAINLVTNTGTSETIVVTNTQGTGAGSVTLTATAGGVDIDAAATLDVDIAGGQVALSSKDDAASAISLTANQGTSETIVVTNTQGTGEGAITLTSTAGGIDLNAATGKNVTVDGGQFAVTSNENVASAIAFTTNTGASETIVVTNTQGTSAAAINLVATAGQITLNSGNGNVVFTNGQTRKQFFTPKEVELDGTNPATLTDIGTDGQANVSTLTFDADGGATGDDIVYLMWHVPDGYVTDSARLNIAYSFSTAEDAADEAQFDFTVNAIAQNEAIDAAGTALADQTTVIAAASTDNGNIHTSQYNIEVEDIVIDDYVIIEVAVDESASALTASSTLDVHYFEIEWESTE